MNIKILNKDRTHYQCFAFISASSTALLCCLKTPNMEEFWCPLNLTPYFLCVSLGWRGGNGPICALCSSPTVNEISMEEL